MIKYDPVARIGGETPNVPYTFYPPFDKKEKVKGVGKFARFVTKRNVLLALAVNVVILLIIPDTVERTIYGSVISQLLMIPGLYLILRKSIPGIIFGTLLTVFALMIFPYHATLLSFLVLIISIIVGVNGRFFRVTFKGGELASLPEALQQVWGVAGGHIGSNTAFGDKARIGAQGEKVFGNALKALVNEFPFVRVFHGVCFTPGVRGADVDHIVLIGRNVFMIDSKNWAPGRYDWHFDGQVLRDSAPFPGGEVHMDAALRKWRDYLGVSVPVRASLVLTRDASSYVLNNARAREVSFHSIPETIDFLKATASKTEPIVDRQAVALIAAQLQA